MEFEDLLPIDVLAHITEELQMRYRSDKDEAEQLRTFEEFLERWETDSSLEPIKHMKFEFDADLDWFNVSHALTLRSLRGKLVVLDFFTYCCINCMHVLPDLHALEQHYPVKSGLVVVGVHSPKFENEKDAANILSAAQRYGISHPIVNDAHSALWRAIGIHCWPSLLILSPTGVPILLLMGEGHRSFLDKFVGVALQYFEQQQQIEKFCLPLKLSTNLLPASNLRFPAKIARSADGRFAIADAGNNRILIVSSDGLVLHKIGGCTTGFVNGDFATTRFNCPQGVSFLDNDVLIVADTENHAVRKITLSKTLVETLVGTGKQGHDRVGGAVGIYQAISSPWDVAVFSKRDMDMSFHLDERNVPEKTIILIAMAGTHQIWGYFPEGIIWWKFRKFDPETCVNLIGNGLEENRNNSYPQNAAFAQPSGLAMANDCLFIADSESSSIRKASMVDGKVMAVVGGDRNPLNLFAFGDVDGKQYNAKMQHPLGVAYNHIDNNVYVADTYNHKIKVIDVATNTISSLIIKNEQDEVYQFNEPAGLCFDKTGQYLLVSDTNNHEIQKVNMQTLTTTRFNLDFSRHMQTSETDAPNNNDIKLQLLHIIQMRQSKKLIINVHITLDESFKFTADAPQKWKICALNSAFESEHLSGSIDNGVFELEFNRASTDDENTTIQLEDIIVDIRLSLCDNKLCFFKQFTLSIRNTDDANALESTELLKTNADIRIGRDQINLL